MKQVTHAELDELVLGALNETPITCGTVANILRNCNIGVTRSGVERSLERLQSAGKVGYVMVPCIRNGYMVQGRHWYDREDFERAKPDYDDDPFEGVAGRMER